MGKNMLLYSLLICFMRLVPCLTGVAKTQSNLQERVVIDLKLIWDPRGVPLDYGYNESNHQNHLISAPGCPKSIDGYPWIHYKLKSSSFPKGDCRCFLAGYQGPCPSGQVLLVKPGCTCGVCACDCLLSQFGFDQEDNNIYQRCHSSSGPMAQVYDKRNKSVCYNLGEQGPCPVGKVVALETKDVYAQSSNSLTCLPTCDYNNDDWIDRQARGECAIVNQGFGAAAGFLTNLQQQDCPPEDKYSKILKKCVRRFPQNDILLG